MRIKEGLLIFYKVCDKKFEEQFECKINEVTFEKITAYMYKPKDASSLAVTRILFGLAMLFDIPDERGGAALQRRWGDPRTCHFPLLPCLRALPMPYMTLVYAAMWLGALGIMLGYKYRVSSATFTLCYWYLFLIEKSSWNNHSYLFGLVGLLLSCTEAGCYWSIDAYQNPATLRKTSVPYWNYFVLKYQFFILYFMAGLKKGTAEWLTGYSVQNLSEHWVFAPFRLFLTVPQTDYLVVHWFIFAFDLTVAVWMMWSRSRNLAMLFCALFHLMNSRLFRIGMFPWVCLATMPLFYPFDWPKLAIQFAKDKASSNKAHIQKYISKFCNAEEGECQQQKLNEMTNDVCVKEVEQDQSESNLKTTDDEEKYDDVFVAEENVANQNNELVEKHNLDQPKNDLMTADDKNEKVIDHNNTTIYLIMLFVILQAFLPYSHFITKGYNNWTNGLYGYSWDMMVHTWEPHSVVVKVVDNDRNVEFYVDPYLFTPNDRWTRHGDMVYQYAQCLQGKISESYKKKTGRIAKNLSIYVDVWCSMNGRFIQRMFDPKVDLLKANWSPFTPTHYLMPILDEALHWRETLDELKDQVRSWSEYFEVAFIADFPGYIQEKYIPTEVRNVSLTVLGGAVVYEPEVTMLYTGQSLKMVEGDQVGVLSGMFHRVLTMGDSPAYYMYTYYNISEVDDERTQEEVPKLPIASELMRRLANMVRFGGIVIKGLQSIFKFSECNVM